MGLKHRFATIVTAGALLAAPALSSAAILFESFVTTPSGGNNTFTLATDGTADIGAEFFSLGTGATIERIAFNAYHDPSLPATTTIDWSIRNDAGGLPGAVVFSSGTSGYTNILVTIDGPFELLDYVIDIPDLAVAAGSYWVTFHLNGNESDPHWSFPDSGDGIDAMSAVSFDGGLTWETPYPGASGDNAFRIEGTAVPAPATFGLFALGLGLLGLRRRRGLRLQ